MITHPRHVAFWLLLLGVCAAIALAPGCSEAHTRPDCYRPAPDAGPALEGDGGPWAGLAPFDPGCRDWRAEVSPPPDLPRPR